LREIREGALTPSGKVYGEHAFTYDEVVNALGLTDLFYWGAPEEFGEPTGPVASLTKQIVRNLQGIVEEQEPLGRTSGVGESMRYAMSSLVKNPVQEAYSPQRNPFDGDSAIVVSGTELAGIVAGMIRAEVEPLIEDSIRKELAGYEIFGEVELTGHLRRKRS
jgi:hypothetical protein